MDQKGTATMIRELSTSALDGFFPRNKALSPFSEYLFGTFYGQSECCIHLDTCQRIIEHTIYPYYSPLNEIPNIHDHEVARLEASPSETTTQ